ncbi:hypothetical protein CVT24_006642, partial [Panaeolus cyanescens]
MSRHLRREFMDDTMDDTPISDDDGLIDCDCGCNKRVTPATWRSHRAGGGSLTLQILRAAASSSGNEQDVQMSPSDDDQHLDLFMSQLDDNRDDELARDDIGQSKRSRSATDADSTLSKRPRPSTPTNAETPRSPFGQPISDTSLPSGSPESSTPHHQHTYHRYQTRLASSRLSRWPAQPVSTAKKSGTKAFIADHPSEDEDDNDDDDDDEYDDMPDLLCVSSDEEDDEDDEEGDKGGDETEDEDDDGQEEDDNQKTAAIRNVFEDMEEEEEEQEEEQEQEDEEQEEEEETGEDNDELDKETQRFAALALEARREAAEAAARRVHEAQTNVLDEDDLDVLRTFVLKTEDHLTERTFKRLSRAYPKQEHLSLKMTRKRAAMLSGFQAVKYDCCVNSCVCFVGPYANLTKCPHCNEDRYTPRKTPRNHFDYLPLIPRLTAMMSNATQANLMSYRSKVERREGIVQDVFDGTHYTTLCKTPIPDQDVFHFSDPRDIALGLSTDGFGPHRRRKKTCWPIILVNYNIPPSERVQKRHVIHIGTVPGPKKPQDWDSYFWPLAQELLELETGVEAFDALSKTLFTLRAHLLFAFGDMPAVSLMMRMKGQNGVSPCRVCLIKGTTGGGRVNYVPLVRDDTEDNYEGGSLPMQTPQNFEDHVSQVEGAATKAQRDLLSTEYGVKGMPLLNELSSISVPASFPLDFMHLIWENLIPNLIRFWKGEFKDLDHQGKGYVISNEDWNEIGAACGSSGRTIPSIFGAAVPNLALQQYYMTAEMYANWTLFIAPIVLRDRFPDNQYYIHFMQLVSLLKLCLDLEYTEEEIDLLEAGFVEWVEEYERLYYQHDYDRLSACPLTIHALLHIAWGIRTAGPVGAYWAFLMERHCNALLPAVRSKRYPYASIGNFVTDIAYLFQIQLLYNVRDSLDLDDPKDEADSFTHRKYPGFQLLDPRRKEVLSEQLKSLVWIALVTRYTSRQRPITKRMVKAAIPLDEPVTMYGKVRIGNSKKDSDQVTGCDMVSPRQDTRDSTFFKYVQLVDKNARRPGADPDFDEKEFYGQLKRILVIKLPKAPEINIHKRRTVILALVQTIVTEEVGGFHCFKRLARNDLIDLATM